MDPDPEHCIRHKNNHSISTKYFWLISAIYDGPFIKNESFKNPLEILLQPYMESICTVPYFGSMGWSGGHFTVPDFQWNRYFRVHDRLIESLQKPTSGSNHKYDVLYRYVRLLLYLRSPSRNLTIFQT
jgi:hypothetical protein